MNKHFDTILILLNSFNLKFDFMEDYKLLSGSYTKSCEEVWDYNKIIENTIIFVIENNHYVVTKFENEYTLNWEILKIILGERMNDSSAYNLYSILEELDCVIDSNNLIIQLENWHTINHNEYSIKLKEWN